MAKLTEAQKKKLKAHSKSQTATHIKAMAKLMRAGKTFSEAHALVSNKSVKQKQKQTQTQKVVINLGTPSKRVKKPRATLRPQSSRVLAQYVQPENMLIPDRRSMINPIIYPSQPFQQSTQPSQIENTFAVRPPAVKQGSITGRAPVEVRLTDGLPERIADDERRKKFLKEEQSLSGFSDTLANYDPPPSSMAAPYDERPVSSNFTMDTSSISTTPSRISTIPTIPSSVSTTPSRIGLGNLAFQDFTRPPRGRPPTQLMRTPLSFAAEEQTIRPPDETRSDILIRDKPSKKLTLRPQRRSATSDIAQQVARAGRQSYFGL